MHLLEIVIPILYTVAVTNLILGVLIFTRSTGKVTNLLFGATVVFVSIWSLAIIGFYSPDWPFDVHWTALTHLSAISIPFFFLLFCNNFPKRIFSNLKLFLSVIPFYAPLVVALFGSELIIGVRVGLEYPIYNGYFVYQLVLSGFFLVGFWLLYKQFKHASGRHERKQVVLVLIGTTISSIPALVTDLIFPFLGVFNWTWMGPLFTTILIVSLFMAMLQYQLFNIKVILTEILSVLLVVVLLLELIISDNVRDVVIKTIVLVFVSILSFLLIRGVYREVAQREQIQKLAEDLEKANEEQGNLIYFITHQVKGFLTKTRNIFSLMLEGDYGPVPPEMLPAIKEGFASDSRGASMVQQVLDASNIKKGTMTYTMVPFDFRALVEKVYKEMESAGKDKGLDMRLDISGEGFTVNGDELQLKQVVKNLLDNAIHYTVKGSVHVLLKKEGDKVVYSVADTGVGMTDDDKSRLFTAGGRGKDSRKTNVDSTGFGLFIVKRIVEAHKGTVSADSAGPGKGSVFKVII